ncbi:hypothetical protein G9A89_002089 [Geosiphon pyriformis]|nr:hypothetical protein G9A89_002089 [Geosiphon pyriformis]
MVDSFTGPLNIEDIGGVSVKPVVSWKSKVGSVFSSISSLLDVKNMANTVAKETSYAESGNNNNMNEAIPRKTRMQMYMLGNSPKQPAFKHMNNDNNALKLSFYISFNSTKSFALDIEISAVLKKTIIDKLMTTKKLTICKKILVNNNLKKINSQSNQKVIVKKILVDLSKLAQKALMEFESSEIADFVTAKWKQALIAYSVFFSGKTWTQIAGGSSSCIISSDFFGAGLFSGAKPISMISNPFNNPCLVDYLAFLEHSLELLSDQVFIIIKKLSFVEMMLLTDMSHVFSPVAQASLVSNLDLDMVLNNILTLSVSSFLVIADTVADFSLSSSKVLITKIDGLESKMVGLKMLVESVLEKLNHLCFGLGSSAPLTSQ